MVLPESIEHFHKWCKENENKSIRDWHSNKEGFGPWYWGMHNPTLSNIPQEAWDAIPTTTNLVEGAHVATNQATGTQLTLMAAIEG